MNPKLLYCSNSRTRRVVELVARSRKIESRQEKNNDFEVFGMLVTQKKKTRGYNGNILVLLR